MCISFGHREKDRGKRIGNRANLRSRGRGIIEGLGGEDERERERRKEMKKEEENEEFAVYAA